jgi:hypothetical protein
MPKGDVYNMFTIGQTIQKWGRTYQVAAFNGRKNQVGLQQINQGAPVGGIEFVNAASL